MRRVGIGGLIFYVVVLSGKIIIGYLVIVWVNL